MSEQRYICPCGNDNAKLKWIEVGKSAQCEKCFTGDVQELRRVLKQEIEILSQEDNNSKVKTCYSCKKNSITHSKLNYEIIREYDREGNFKNSFIFCNKCIEFQKDKIQNNVPLE